MRKVLIALAAAGSALALASPASAQYYPQPQQPYGYNGYGHNGYGYNGFGQVQQLQQRIDALQNRSYRRSKQKPHVEDGDDQDIVLTEQRRSKTSAKRSPRC